MYSLTPYQRRVFAEREALDAVIGRIKSAQVPRPKKGWIKSIREALGIRTGQLAKRVGIDASTLTRLEQNESKGSITLESLERIARALDCELVYAFIPKLSLFETITARADKLLAKDRDATYRSMELEDQGNMDSQSIRDDILKAMLVTKLDPRLWEDF